VKSPLVHGFVAHEEAELRGAALIAGFEVVILVMKRAIAQPVVLRHALHQDGFGGRGGIVFGLERLQEILVGQLALGVEDAEGAE
jgi:hypothetical protein